MITLLIVAIIVIFGIKYTNKKAEERERLEKETATNPDTSQPYSSEKARIIKKRKVIDSTNIILYLGSFLIVAGSGGLLMSATGDTIKLFILLFMVLAFYIGGILIRKNKKILIAGNAFICTALAVVPFLGFAFAGFAGLSPELSWLLTSVLGLFMFIVAAVIINSPVIAYFSMAFFVSFACSTSAVLQLSIIWYFLFVIGAGIILNLISLLTKKSLPAPFRTTITQVGRWLPFLTTAASFLVVGTYLVNWSYVIITGICLLQLVTNYFLQKTRLHEVLLRIMSYVFILCLASATFGINTLIFAIIFGALTLIESFFSFYLSISKPHRKNETIIAIAGLILSMFSALFVIPDPQSFRTIALIFAILNTIISTIYCLLSRETDWLYSTISFAVLAPLCIKFSTPEIYSIIYIIEFILTSSLLLSFKQHTKKLHHLNIFNLIIYSLILLVAPFNNYFIHIVTSFVIPALGWLLTGFKTKQKPFYEIAIYFATLALFFFIINPTSFIHGNTALCIAIFAHLVGIALFSSGMLYGESNHRIDLGVALFSIIMLYAITSALHVLNMPSTYLGPETQLLKSSVSFSPYQVIFLAEEIAITFAGLIKKRKPIIIIGLISAGIEAIRLSSGIAYLWVIFLGLVLIGIVIWRLLKHQEPKDDNSSSQSPSRS